MKGPGGRAEVIGVVAGAGRLPVLLARAVRSRGHPVVVITVEGDGAEISRVADSFHRVGFAEMRRIIDLLISQGVRRVLFSGTVSRARVIAEGDDVFRTRVRGVADRGDQALFQQVALEMFTGAGMEVASPLEFIGALLVAEGVLGAQTPSDDQWKDVHVGMRLARSVAGLDLGQTVVLKDGIVLAVEAAEGTDEAIRRGASYAQEVVVAKAARPHQDERFDVPTVGIQTIETMVGVRAAVLAVEAARTLLIDREECLDLADRSGIALVGVPITA